MEVVQMHVPTSPSFPVELFIRSDGNISLLPRNIGKFYIMDLPPEGGVTGTFDESGFTLQVGMDEPAKYMYDVPYAYKSMPVLKAWLVQQKLTKPEIN